MWAETALSFVFGLIWGSFANVVIYRYQKGESVVLPASRCTACATPIRWYDNIPVLSWLILRAKCRKCGAKISARYPTVELLTGTLFALIVFKHGYQWVTLEYIVFAWSLVVVSFIDFDQMILPDVFTLSGIVIGLLCAAINPCYQSHSAGREGSR